MMPQRRLLWLVGLLAVAGLAGLAGPVGVLFWWFVAGLLFLGAIVDFLRGVKAQAPQVSRHMAHSMALLVNAKITLRFLRTDRQMAARLVVFDHCPESFATDAFPSELELEVGKRASLVYSGVPQVRGDYEFAAVELRLASPWRLWWRKCLLPVQDRVRVYPNFSRVTRSVLKAEYSPLATNGLHLRRQRGEGLEFHELRDYREGDSMRALDWKATARMGRMIARDYRDERDQHIVFVVDAGRRMRAKDGVLSHFDHTLNALLLLSYVALRQGDSVSVMTLGAKRSWLPARKGPGAINDVLNHIYAVEPAPIEVDYVAAATDLSLRQKRRGLVILLTNVRDEDGDDLARATRLLQTRHLVMLASLREGALDEARTRTVDSLDDALTVASADHYLATRHNAQALLRANGVFVEDCLCDDLAEAITNRYMAIKRAGML